MKKPDLIQTIGTVVATLAIAAVLWNFSTLSTIKEKSQEHEGDIKALSLKLEELRQQQKTDTERIERQLEKIQEATTELRVQLAKLQARFPYTSFKWWFPIIVP
jgi:septal ring factor EnvC (AmiA/AmiB activator)